MQTKMAKKSTDTMVQKDFLLQYSEPLPNTGAWFECGLHTEE